MLKLWWDAIIVYGKFIGYNVNPKKSWLIVKQQHLQCAQETFSSTGIQITTEGRRQLGAVIGTDEYKKHYVSSLVDTWVGELDILPKIAKIEPHAAYAAFTHGLQHRYTYAMRTTVFPILVMILNALMMQLTNL